MDYEMAGCANTSVVAIDIPSKGRALVAGRKFAAGDEIFSEEPLASCQFLWNTRCHYAACHHCQRPLETAEQTSRRLTANPALDLPQTQCCEVDTSRLSVCSHCQVAYCCSECRDAAWAGYHQTLCLAESHADPAHPLNLLAEAWRNMHYPPETCSIMLLARIIATIKQSVEPEKLKSVYSSFCQTPVNERAQITHKLLGPKFNEQQELLRGLLADALYDDLLQTWFTPEGFQSLLALIGTNGQGIGTSSLSVWVKNCEGLGLPTVESKHLDTFIDKLYDDIDRVSGQFLNCEGSGLYALQSTANHSCQPNAEVTFPNNNFRLVMKAIADIEQGEEICICYLSECDRQRSRHSRQKILRENYLFCCTCPLCTAETDEMDLTSEEGSEESSEEEEEEEEEDATMDV